MKVVRLRTGEQIAYGVPEREGIRVFEGSPFVAWQQTDVIVPYAEARLLAPVFPTKVVCVGKNYVAHADEMDFDVPSEPLIFLKPATAVIGPGAPIMYPRISKNVHHEAELAVVIGSVAHHVKAEDAESVIFGYTAANDVTARDLQLRDGQWTRGKGFDTFCPLGPAIETELDPREGLAVSARVNGETRQSGSTADMVFGVGELIEFISEVMTLLPGDVILTGTPSGVGPMLPGDRVDVEVERIGILSNQVAAS
ncbi:ureidoglycolate lyase [bacterium BMS3Abin02]|nr:ureidoglycolate lyase [bacterium BMS3Abin02]GBE23537.1 ureidoglycolate lyase [bacterium BMS3Bbin01]HDH27190.1 FAA hydrolase family protein [Actinomycetota bacterium]HDK45508.1 FAA hydrolase family protein [Actinomycetota bacterium]HDL50142.1 FAA hydrolase family protein [Actinomycetota bacterium]